MKTFSSLFFFLFLLRGGTLDTEMPPLLVLMDVILVVALIPEGLVLWKNDLESPHSYTPELIAFLVHSRVTDT